MHTNILRVGVKRMGMGSFQTSNRTKGNGHKLNHIKSEPFKGDTGWEQATQRLWSLFLWTYS